MSNGRNDRRQEQLTDVEIALIKAMQQLGRARGFHNQEILSYFSRPGRSINPARLVEIAGGERGANIEPASAPILADFLARFSVHETNGRHRNTEVLPDIPSPSPIGIVGNELGFVLPGDSDIADINQLRQELIHSCRSQCEWFVSNIRYLQIDQSLLVNFSEVSLYLSAEPCDLNSSGLFASVRVARRMARLNKDGLSDQAAYRWDQLERDVVVLLDTYPLFKRYREVAAQLDAVPSPSALRLQGMLDVLRSDDGTAFIRDEVPRIVEQISKIDESERNIAVERNLALSGILTQVLRYAQIVAKIIPLVDQNASAVRNFVRIYWPMIRDWLDEIRFWD